MCQYFSFGKYKNGSQIKLCLLNLNTCEFEWQRIWLHSFKLIWRSFGMIVEHLSYTSIRTPNVLFQWTNSKRTNHSKHSKHSKHSVQCVFCPSQKFSNFYSFYYSWHFVLQSMHPADLEQFTKFKSSIVYTWFVHPNFVHISI